VSNETAPTRGSIEMEMVEQIYREFQKHLDKQVVGYPPQFDYACSCFFSILAQASFNVTVRLKTGTPGRESSGSAKK